MGQHVFTLKLRTSVSDPAIKDGESGASIEVAPEALYQALLNLRNEVLVELDDLNAEDFKTAVITANQFNESLARLEELGAFLSEEEE